MAVGDDASDAERLRDVRMPMHGLSLARDCIERTLRTIAHADELVAWHVDRVDL